MKKPKKFDILIFAAFFISFSCLIATVILQNNINKKLLVISAENEVTYTAKAAQSSIITSDRLTSSAAGSPFAENVENNDVGIVSYGSSTSSFSASTSKVKVTSGKATTEKCTEIDSVLIVNKNTKKIHSSTCSYAIKTKDENKFPISSDELPGYLNNGYSLCSVCHGYKE